MVEDFGGDGGFDITVASSGTTSETPKTASIDEIRAKAKDIRGRFWYTRATGVVQINTPTSDTASALVPGTPETITLPEAMTAKEIAGLDKDSGVTKVASGRTSITNLAPVVAVSNKPRLGALTSFSKYVDAKPVAVGSLKAYEAVNLTINFPHTNTQRSISDVLQAEESLYASVERLNDFERLEGAKALRAQELGKMLRGLRLPRLSLDTITIPTFSFSSILAWFSPDNTPSAPAPMPAEYTAPAITSAEPVSTHAPSADTPKPAKTSGTKFGKIALVSAAVVGVGTAAIAMLSELSRPQDQGHSL